MEATEKVEHTQEEQVFGRVMVVQDTALVQWLEDKERKINGYLTRAEEFEITNPAGKEIAKETILRIRSEKKLALDAIKPFKDRINSIRQLILDKEKVFSVPADKAESIFKTKLNDRLDLEETERKKEEERLRDLAEKDRQKRLTIISDKLDRLTNGITDLATQKQALESALREGLTEEEGDALRARIEAVEAKLSQAQGKIISQQTKVQEAAVQTTVTVKTEKVAGTSSKKVFKCVGVSNPKALLKEILEGRVGIGVVTFNLPQIAKLKNMGVEIYGADFVEERDTRIKK